MRVFLEGLNEQERPTLSEEHEPLGLGPRLKKKEKRSWAVTFIPLCFLVVDGEGAAASSSWLWRPVPP